MNILIGISAPLRWEVKISMTIKTMCSCSSGETVCNGYVDFRKMIVLEVTSYKDGIEQLSAPYHIVRFSPYRWAYINSKSKLCSEFIEQLESLYIKWVLGLVVDVPQEYPADLSTEDQSNTKTGG